MAANARAEKRKRFDRFDVRIPDGSASIQSVDLIGIAGGQLGNSFFHAVVAKNCQTANSDDAKTQHDKSQRRVNSSTFPQARQTNNTGESG
jgi:hypothetical protein